MSRRCRHNRVQAEDNGRKSNGRPRGKAGNCALKGLTENAPVERFHSPIAGGLQPAGKGRAPSLTAVIRPRLPGAGAESRLPRGRQARPDLTRVKSGKSGHDYRFHEQTLPQFRRVANAQLHTSALAEIRRYARVYKDTTDVGCLYCRKHAITERLDSCVSLSRSDSSLPACAGWLSDRRNVKIPRNGSALL